MADKYFAGSSDSEVSADGILTLTKLLSGISESDITTYCFLVETGYDGMITEY